MADLTVSDTPVVSAKPSSITLIAPSAPGCPQTPDRPSFTSRTNSPSYSVKSYLARSCNECRRRKGKCVGKGHSEPCEFCQARGFDCTWEKEDGRRPLNRQLFESLRLQNQALSRRVEALEEALRQKGILPSCPAQHPRPASV